MNDIPQAVTEQVARQFYGLSPLQSGMLFQALLDNADCPSAGYDIEQLHLVFEEALDTTALEAAWRLIAKRHPILTTSFHWDGLDEPRQRVDGDVTIQVEGENWSGLRQFERKCLLEEFLLRDRRRGFNLQVAPLMRVTLFHVSDTRSELVWSFHHALLDGRSFGTLLRETLLAYDAIRADQPLKLPAAPRPYADFIAWLERQDQQRSDVFFRELLAGKSEPTPLPCAEPALRPLIAEGYGEVLHVVSKSIVEAARRAASRTNTSLNTMLQAAWALVLLRYTGDTDVVFGATRACRHSALEGSADGMIGLFSNTLPVRVRLAADRTVAEVLQDIRQQSLAIRPHEHASLAHIQTQAGFGAGNPLFGTLVMFESHGLCQDLLESGGPHWTRCQIALHEQPSLPLNLAIYDGQRLEVRALYDRQRFQSATINRLLASLGIALEELSVDEGRPVSQIDVLPSEERQRILFEWNDTERPFPDQLCIHNPFESQVARRPDALAVEMDGCGLTYRQLEERANRMAHALRARGARPGRYVGIGLSRGLDLVVALLAVAKSGAAYVPLDPQYPRERLAFMVSDAQLLCVVTEERYRALFDAPLLVLDADGLTEVSAMPAERPVSLASSQDTCYAIFTSGSTGAPKGVVLSHRAVMNTFDWVSRTFGIGPGDRLLFVTSPCFDLSVYDTFGVLGAGGTVVIASSKLLLDPEALASAIVDQYITVLDLTPAALQQLVQYFPESSKTAPMRLVLLSGDWIPVALPDTVRAAFPEVRIQSLGGATEAAIWSNWYQVGLIDPRWTSIPYGKPIQNSQYYVLDERLRPVPVGVAGDLYIGGMCLANGYLKREELTGERFLPNPYRVGERLYKTGDVARYFEDGDLEFLGRADFQVKLRGFRVELGEVETVLCSLSSVREAVCAAHRDAPGQKSLVAYVVLKDGAVENEDSIKAAVAGKTPDFMVPSQVMLLSAMPLSSNGKLDRNALPHPGTQARLDLPLAPRSELEFRMAGLWEEILQRKPIGIREDFFKLGGHSLLAVLLVLRIKTRLGLDVPLSRVVKMPTIEALVQSMDENNVSTDERSRLVTFNAMGSRPPLFFFPGAGGGSSIYRALPMLLGQDQPVYAFDAINACGVSAAPNPSIEEMADIYVREVLQARPNGPYILAGYSFGALVAFEVARQLRKRGLNVLLLISLDGYAPGFPRRMALPARLVSHLRLFLKADTSGRRKYLKERLGSVKRSILERLGYSEHLVEDVALEEMDIDEFRRQQWRKYWRTRNRYSPTDAEPSNLLLIKAEMQDLWMGCKMDDPLYGWQKFVHGSVTTVTVPGQHPSLLEGNNKYLIARAIAAHISPHAEPS